MTDQDTTGTMTTSAGDPGTTGSSSTAQQPPSQSTDWEARYKGQVQANSKQAIEIQNLRDQLAQKEQEIATLMGEKDTLKVSFETKLRESGEGFLKLKQEKDAGDKDKESITAELAKLRALSQHPELMMYADLIQPTTVQAELEAQIAKVQQIHVNSLESARKGLQQQGFAPPTAPPATAPGQVTEATLTKELEKAKEDLRMGRIKQSDFLQVTSELGEKYNLLQRGKGGQ